MEIMILGAILPALVLVMFIYWGDVYLLERSTQARTLGLDSSCVWIRHSGWSGVNRAGEYIAGCGNMVCAGSIG